MSDQIRVGDFTIRSTGRQRITGESIDSYQGAAEAECYEVRGPGGVDLVIRDARWESGERDVAVLDRGTCPQHLDRLRNGLRLQVARHGQFYVELRQARLKEGGWSNLFAATEHELDAGAGTRAFDALYAAGAQAVGTREILLGDQGRTRSRLGATFREEADAVPVVAYVLTRVAPLARGLAA